MNENLIIVFIRNPELGKVKTRLAKTIGNKSALNIYKFLLNHTEKTIRDIKCHKAIYYSEQIIDNDLWSNDIYKKYEQKGDDLGMRMLNAIQDAFNKNYKKVVIVGSDLFDLKTQYIIKSFNKLETHNIVVGPATDGGYYLLGMKKLHKSIFINKTWGTDTVLTNTIKDLKNENVFLLKPLNDIDTYNDIESNNTLKKLIVKND